MEQLSFGASGKTEREQGEWITAYCDGGSRGNPGPAGFGVYIQDDKGAVVAELSEFLGRKTNNYAEYSGMLAALQFALESGHERLRVISDSELMVKQIKGQYRVNSPELRPLYEEAKRRITQLRSFQIQHVLRDKNKHADGLANLAMDRGMGRGNSPEESRPVVLAPVTPIPISRIPIAKIPIARIPIARSAPTSRPIAVLQPAAKPVRGVVRAGVVHFLDGNLPDGVLVKITPE